MTRTPLAAFTIASALLLPAAAWAQEDTADLKTQLEEQRARLDQMAAELETLKKAGDAEGADAADAAPTDAADDGAEKESSWMDSMKMKALPPTIEALDGKIKLTIRGRLMTDLRASAEHGHPDIDDTFQVRRARIEFRGHLFERLTYDIGLEFGRTSDADGRNLFLNLEILQAVQVRAGQMLLPFSDLRLNSSKYLNHMERTILVNQQVSPREIGAMLWGNLLDDKLSYFLGVYNGNGQNLKIDDDDNFDFVSRVEVRPFGDSDLSFSLNYIYTPSNRANTVPPDAQTNLGTGLVEYDGAVAVLGHRERFGGGFKFSKGPFEIKGEGGFDYFHNVVSATDSADLLNWGYFIDFTYVLTGETLNQKKDGARVEPAEPFYDPVSKKMGIGAYQLSLRLEDYYADPSTSDGGFATTNAETVRVVSATAHWYPWKYVRFSVNYSFSHFQDAIVDSEGNRHIDEHGVIARFAFWF